jgi:hypothetical protein
VKCAQRRQDQLLLASLSLIVSLNLIEQIPNASINSWTWFLSGVLLGQSQRLLKQRAFAGSAVALRRSLFLSDAQMPNAAFLVASRSEMKIGSPAKVR